MLRLGMLLFSSVLAVYAGQAQPSLPADTSRVRAIEEAVRQLPQLTTDSSRKLIEAGYRLAHDLKDFAGMAAFSRFMGFAALEQENYGAALPYFKRAAREALLIPDSLRWARLQVNLGLLQYQLGRSDSAMACYQLAARTLDRLGQPNAALFNNMAIIYRKEQQYQEAISLYERSLALKQADGDLPGVATTYLNLGLVYGWMEDTVRSLDYAMQALAIFEQLDDQENIAVVRVSIGHTLMNLAQDEQAWPHLEAAYQYYRNHQEAAYYRLRAAFGLGELSRRRGEPAAAYAYLREALALSREKGWQEDEEQSLLYLSKALLEAGQANEAYTYLAEAYALRDTLRQQSRLALEEEMQARFEVQQAEQKNLLQALEFEQQQRLYLGLLLLAGLLIGGVSLFLWQKNRSNRQLAHKHAQLEQAMNQKEALMKEMNHRVKNHLQFVSSLLRLQTDHVADGQARQVLDASRGRVLSMALIHRHLYQDSGTAIQLDTYLQRIVDELIGAFADPSWDLAVDTQLVPLRLDVEQAIPLGLILNELVTNALKYAFKPGKPNHLQLRLEPSGKQLILEVSDNGQAASVSAPAGQGDGFGQELLQLMTDRLDAEMERESNNGTRVRLIFPFSPAA